MRGSFGNDRRLRARPEFARVQRGGVRVVSAHFVFLLAAREEQGPSRLGLVVSRKVGNAVARNRVKRVCRECFRLGVAALPDGIDLVLIARSGAHTLGFDACAREWGDVKRKLEKQALAALAKAPPKPHVSAQSAEPAGPEA